MNVAVGGHVKVRKPKFFYVRYTVTVDRPELRGPSYQVVPAGTKMPSEDFYGSQSGAVQFFESLMSGEMDFPSEYISSASVEQRNSYGENRRTVRKGGFRQPDPMKRMRYCASCREPNAVPCKTCAELMSKYPPVVVNP